MTKKLFFLIFALAAAHFSLASDKPDSAAAALLEAGYLDLTDIALSQETTPFYREYILLAFSSWPDISEKLRPKMTENARMLQLLIELKGPPSVEALTFQEREYKGLLPPLPIEKESLMLEAALSQDVSRRRAAKAVFSHLQLVSEASIIKILSDDRLSEAFFSNPDVFEHRYEIDIFWQFAAAALRSLEPHEGASKKVYEISPASKVRRVSMRPGNEAGYKILEFFEESRPRGGIIFSLKSLNSLEAVFGADSSDSPARERQKILAAEFLALANPDKKVLDIMEKALTDPSPKVRRAAEYSFKRLRAAKRELSLNYREARRAYPGSASVHEHEQALLPPPTARRLRGMQMRLINRKCREAITDLKNGRLPGPARSGAKKLLEGLKAALRH